MSEVKKIATREELRKCPVETGQKSMKILWFWTLTLLRLPRPVCLKKVFPERHIDCGIAERLNMAGIAAGLSTTGKVPSCDTFAMLRPAVLLSR